MTPGFPSLRCCMYGMHRLKERLNFSGMLVREGASVTLLVHAEDAREAAPLAEAHGVALVILEATPLPPTTRLRRKLLRLGAFFARGAGDLTELVSGRSLLTAWARSRDMLWRLQAEYLLCAPRLRALAPHSVIVWSDNKASLEMAFIKAAKDQTIRVVIPNLAFSVPYEGGVTFRQGKPEYHAPTSGWLPEWMRRRPGLGGQVHKGTLFYTPDKMLALDAFGALPATPWFLGGGLADALCVGVLSELEQYAAAGVPRKKLRLTGHVAFDAVWRGYQGRDALRTKLLAEARSSATDRPFVMLTPPPYLEHRMLPAEAHWREMRFLFETVATLQPHAHVVVSLHPRMDPAIYEPMVREYGLIPQRGDTAETVPAMDVVVSAYSSISLWALFCGAVNVFIDFFGYEYSFFKGLATPITARRHDELPAALTQALCSRPTARPEDDSAFRADFTRLGRDAVFDGCALTRYLDILRREA